MDRIWVVTTEDEYGTMDIAPFTNETLANSYLLATLQKFYVGQGMSKTELETLEDCNKVSSEELAPEQRYLEYRIRQLVLNSPKNMSEAVYGLVKEGYIEDWRAKK